MCSEKNINDKIPIIVICGPTASGKTNVSIELSKILDIEIISADSRQIYKYLDIGTAKPTHHELAQVKHHFINYLSPDEPYSAGQFGNEAYQCLIDIKNRNKIPVIVGGSGLYIKSLCEGFFDSDFNDGDSDEKKYLDVRAELDKELNDKGIDFLYDKLKNIDAELYDLYSDKNPRRIQRALEYFYVNNIKLSDA
jgi:tRNA dimethylallyltransferase